MAINCIVSFLIYYTFVVHVKAPKNFFLIILKENLRGIFIALGWLGFVAYQAFIALGSIKLNEMKTVWNGFCF